MSNTYSKIKLSRGKADEKVLNTQSPTFDFDQKYNFRIEPFAIPSSGGTTLGCVEFDSTYDNKDEYLSRFFLDPDDAITLGSHLIRTALRCKAYNTPIIDRDDYMNKLLLDIKLGYVDTLVVKFHKRECPEFPTSESYDNYFWHLYNIYPIYRYGIKNGHFNFNIPLNITDYRSYSGDTSPISLKRKVEKAFNIDSTLHVLDDDDAKTLKHLKHKYPTLIAENSKPVKIKLVNVRKIAKEDMDESIEWNIDRKKELELKKQANINYGEAEENIDRAAKIRELVKSTPKEADGTIDFNKIMQKIINNTEDTKDNTIEKIVNNSKIFKMELKED